MLFNVVGFNMSWFGLVILGNSFIPFALIFLVYHLIYKAKKPNERTVVLAITLTGIGVDSLLQYLDIFVFADTTYLPLWLAVLWACFATTIGHSLQVLSHSKLLQILVGGLVAPLSYIGGYKLQAVGFGLPLLDTYIVLALIWSNLFLFFYFLKNHFVDRGIYDE